MACVDVYLKKKLREAERELEEGSDEPPAHHQ
jgi:hypothetical protein